MTGTNNKRRRLLRAAAPLVAALLTACAATQPEPEEPPSELRVSAIEGSWERDYSRDDDVNAKLQRAYNLLARSIADRQRMAAGGPAPSISPAEANSLLALARLVELITRPDVLRISRDEATVIVSREKDFALTCEFRDGRPVPTKSPFGVESCDWRDGVLISRMRLLDGLTLTQQFIMSDDGQKLRITTTATSPQTRAPFSLRRFYRRFEEPAPKYECVETLSMKRVCSTRELEL